LEQKVKKILICCHAFPPAGGPGVQRIAKLVKYLTKQGYEIEVVTASPVSYKIRDQKLLQDLPATVPIYRTWTLEIAWLLNHLSMISFEKKNLSVGSPDPKSDTIMQGKKTLLSMVKNPLRRLLKGVATVAEVILATPDVYAGWLPFALVKSLRRVQIFKPDVVLTTGGPFSGFVLPWILQSLYGIPYILDYRDAWMLNPYRVHGNKFKQHITEKMEKSMLQNAAAVVVVTRDMEKDFLRTFSYLEDKIHLIHNGFDPDDFQTESLTEKNTQIFKLVYTGTFTQSRTSRPFLESVVRLREENPQLFSSLRLTFVGNAGNECQSLVKEFQLSEICEFTGYLSHQESIAQLMAADALLLVTGKDPSEVTGKVFEYLHARRPILALTHPNGSLATILRKSGSALVACREDRPEICCKLQAMMDGTFVFAPKDHQIKQYSREEIAHSFAKIIEKIGEENE
jgi:glycosyltransferase involved in cell wall biosynthesis